MKGSNKLDVLGVAERDHIARKGGGIIFLNEDKGNSKVIDIVRQCDNFLIHQQIEIKNGLLFMRLKKRSPGLLFQTSWLY